MNLQINARNGTHDAWRGKMNNKMRLQMNAQYVYMFTQNARWHWYITYILSNLHKTMKRRRNKAKAFLKWLLRGDLAIRLRRKVYIHEEKQGTNQTHSSWQVLMSECQITIASMCLWVLLSFIYLFTHIFLYSRLTFVDIYSLLFYRHSIRTGKAPVIRKA